MSIFESPAYARLLQLQREVYDSEVTNLKEIDAFEGYPEECYPKVLFSPCGESFHLEFRGQSMLEQFEVFMRSLTDPLIANNLLSLRVSGEDDGANGVRFWDVSSLLNSDIVFPKLTEVFFEPSELSWHNTPTILCNGSLNEGLVAPLVAKMPLLRSLTVPSCPEPSFFELPLPNLRELRVVCGFRNFGLFKNLALPKAPRLRHVEFHDVGPDAWHFPEQRTPFEDILNYLLSPSAASLGALVFTNGGFSEEQQKQLHLARPKMKCIFVDVGADWSSREWRAKRRKGIRDNGRA
jgi:hypothetical protein